MKSISNNRIAINAVLNTIRNILGIIFPLITFPYISRVLGVETLGIYNFSASVVSYFLLIAGLGISTYGIREGTQYRENKKDITRFVNEVFSINMISTVVSYFLLITSLIFIEKLHNYRFAILILSIEIMATTLSVAWVCNIFEDFLFVTIRTLIIQLISLIFILAIVKKSDDLYKYIFIIVSANSGSSLLNFFYIRKKYCKFKFVLKIDWKKHFKPIMIIFFTSVAITLYVSFDTTMLGLMRSAYEVGLYGTAVKIYTILKNVLASFLMVLIPQFSLMFAKDRREESAILFSKVFNVLTAIMLPVAVGLFILSEDILILISGKEFIGAAESLRLLSIAILFSLYAYMYVQCVLIPMKKEHIVFKATVTSAIVNIGLNFMLIPMWGINATAATTIAAEAVTFVIVFIESRKYISLVKLKKDFISVIAGCVAIILVCIFTRHLESYILRIGVSSIVSAPIYFLVLIVLKNSILIEVVKGGKSFK